jgi:hypothetical protein
VELVKVFCEGEGVLAKESTCAWQVGGFEGVNDRLVDLGEGVEGWFESVKVEAGTHPYFERVPDSEDGVVGGETDDGAVELNICVGESLDVSGESGCPHGVLKGLERGDGFLEEFLGDELGGDLFKVAAKLIDFAGFVDGEVADAGSAVSLGYEDAESLKLAEGLADGCLTDFEFLGEREFLEALARGVGSVGDALEQGAADAVTRGLGWSSGFEDSGQRHSDPG